MNVDTKGPYTIDRIHYFTTERGAQVRSLTLHDGDGNDIGMRFDRLCELRTIAAGIPLGKSVSLTLSLNDRAIWDRDLIRRWINGDDLAFAGPVASQMEAGAAE